MTSVLDSIIKLPRYVKILASNGTDETTAFVNDKIEYSRQYYKDNRNWILEKKRTYNSRPEVKKRSKEYHHNYYLIHKEEIYKKQK